MKHLIICPEYPPAPIPPGGIGTYVTHIAKLLAESGETVHVIGQLCEGAKKKIEEKCQGRLIIHRISVDAREAFSGRNVISASSSPVVKGLLQSGLPSQCFSWQACLFAENLIEQEGIDIIEAQDYEAPLYYFQLRRVLGMGPKRCPPCIIHLHSPTETIARYNDWDTNDLYFRTAKRLEDYSIGTADALFCPSRFLSHYAEAYYGLAHGTIRIIPLPLGDNPTLEREKDTWEHGTICYVGRLQRLKGVIEWIDAAVNIALEYPTVRFEFIGTNLLSTDGMSGAEFLDRRIPEKLRMRFSFRGEQKRSSLLQFLGKARIAVVPSRWENFPNTCVEAMCSGLPVLTTRQGGQAEMVEDGRTGWLTNKPGSEGLADALTRALKTSSAKIAEMGAEASVAIRKLCDNRKIVESHLDFRSQIVHQGPSRSFYLPVNLPWIKRPLSDNSARRTPQNKAQQGLAIVVNCFNNGQFLGECLQSLKQQTRKPLSIVIVDEGSTEEQTFMALNQSLREGWQVLYKSNRAVVSAKNAGIEAVLKSGLNPLGFAFLSAEERLHAGYVDACESVLQRCPNVGLVSCWTQHYGANDKIRIKPCPAFPYQWLANEAAPFSVIRTEALREAGNFRPVSRGYEDWDLFNAVMAAGWIAVTIPAIMGSYKVEEDLMQREMPDYSYRKVHQDLLERFPEMIVRDARDIVLLAASNMAQSLCEMKQVMLRNRHGIVLRALRKAKKKVLRRVPVWLTHAISRVTR